MMRRRSFPTSSRSPVPFRVTTSHFSGVTTSIWSTTRFCSAHSGEIGHLGIGDLGLGEARVSGQLSNRDSDPGESVPKVTRHLGRQGFHRGHVDYLQI